MPPRRPHARSRRPPRRILLLIPLHRARGRHVLAGIARYAREHADWNFLNGRPLSNLEEIPASWQGEGIIGELHREPLITQVRRLKVPAVNLRAGTEDFPSVTTDGLRGAELAAEHLYKLGLEHFAYFGREHTWATAEAFKAPLAERGLPCRISYGYRLEKNEPARPGSDQRQLRRWLRHLPKPLGLYTEDDIAAWMILHAAQQLDIHIPNDLALVSGAHDEFIGEVFSPSLSSVMMPYEKQGYEAARLLDRLLQGKQPPARPLMLAPTGVVARQSSDILAVAEPRVAQAVRFIRAGDLRAMQVADVLRAVGLSRTALDNLFRQALGHSVAAEIRRTRLERAKQQLMATGHSLSNIAAEAGFSNTQYMAACFRRELGVSPGVFRHRTRTT